MKTFWFGNLTYCSLLLLLQGLSRTKWLCVCMCRDVSWLEARETPCGSHDDQAMRAWDLLPWRVSECCSCSVSTVSALLTGKHPSERQRERERDFPKENEGPQTRYLRHRAAFLLLRGWQSRQGAPAMGGHPAQAGRCRQSSSGSGSTRTVGTSLCACKIGIIVPQG